MDVFDLRMDWKIGRLEVGKIGDTAVLPSFLFSTLPQKLKVGSGEDRGHSGSSLLPVFHPSSKVEIYFLILLSADEN